MEVCRLCLDLVATQGDAKPLDGETRDMVQVVAPELNLEASKNPSVCSECQKTLSRLFDFKSRVFEHEGEIREKVGDRRGTVSLKAAVTGEADPPLDPDRDKAKDRLCRTCLAPIECESFTVLRPSEPDAYLSSMLDMCLVEVDLALTKDPVMCEGCLDNLQKLHHFKSSCQDVEDKIVDYCNKNKLKESTVVDLHAVLESERPRDIEMLTVKDEDGASGSKIKDEEKEVEPKSEDEDEEMSEDEEEDEEMSEDEEVKQEELDIKSETEPGTSDSDKCATTDDHEILGIPEGLLEICTSLDLTEQEHGVDAKMFQCSKCNYKSTERRMITRHEKAVHEGLSLYKCSMCSANFKSTYALNLHRKNKHGADIFTFECSKCSFKSIDKRNLTRHEKVVHEGIAIFKCTMCSDNFKSTGKLDLHKKKKHGVDLNIFQCSKCNYKSIERRMLTRHEKAVHEGISLYNCNMCSTNFKSIFTLNLHRKNKHGMEVTTFKCSKCSFNSVEKRNVTRHEKAVHENMSLFNCSICSENFKSTRKLNLHRNKKHKADLETFQCSKCSFKSFAKRCLTRHENNVHEGMSLRTCSSCSANFKSLLKLKQHRKNDHGIDVHIFQCSKCSFISIEKRKLTKHEKTVHPK